MAENIEYDDVQHAVTEAVETVKQYSPADPSAQPAVVLDIGESKYNRLEHTGGHDWLELRIQLAIEIEGQTGGVMPVDALK